MITKAQPTGMIIDGALSVETPDSSGEIVKIKGVDMSSFDVDGIYLNYEHVQPKDQNKDGAEKKEANGRELVGKLIYYKKIFIADDCENDRQRMYFDKYNGVPYLYGVFRLFDGAGHDSARALAAIIRDCVANDERIDLRYSVEGNTLDTDPRNKHILTDTIVRAIALTKRPCNKAASSGLMFDPNAPEGFSKNPNQDDEDNERISDILDNLIDSQKAEPHPLFQPIGAGVDVELSPIVVDATKRRSDLKKALGTLFKAKLVKAIMNETSELRKALTAGGGGGAPSTLTGGAALAPESLKKRMLGAIRDCSATEKSEIRAFLKAQLPEVDDTFLDHFVDVASDYKLKRAALRASLSKADDDDYRGSHKAPRKEYGAPLHDLSSTGIYPADIYGPSGRHYYGTGADHHDNESFNAVYAAKGKPHMGVKVYRAVPHEPSNEERIAQIEKAKAHFLKRGVMPAGVTGSYDSLANELDRLKAMPPRPPSPKLTINPGDWVTTSRSYAVEHGHANLGGKFKVLSKTVPARHLFTDGNSINEWGYDPSVDQVKKSEEPSALFCKLEALTVDLRKAAADVEDEIKKPKKTLFAGHKVTPGRATTADGDYELLHENDSHYVARPAGKSDPEDLVRLPKSKELTHFIVHEKPVVLVADL